MTGYDFSNLTVSEPHKPLTRSLRSKAGRNNAGRITVRHRWWGHKRLYRLVDFRGYDKVWIPAVVTTIEYDPNRTARIALVTYADGEKRYVLAWKWISVWQPLMCGEDARPVAWNRKQLRDIPDGFSVFAVEVTPMTKGKLLRSAWNSATLTGRDEEKWVVYLKLPSGEVRLFNDKCWATIGVVGNDEHKNIVIGKAWRMRWMWRRPVVLGKSMNPVDHPHGWGEWHTDIALKAPKSFSGKPVPPGKKTRTRSKWSDKFIVSRKKK
jgi:large subunit ribosomal protein L2